MFPVSAFGVPHTKGAMFFVSFPAVCFGGGSPSKGLLCCLKKISNYFFPLGEHILARHFLQWPHTGSPFRRVQWLLQPI